MIDSASNVLDRASLRELLKAVGSQPSDAPQPEYVPYDWKACRVFKGEAWQQIGEAAGGLAKAFGTVFREVCEGDFEAVVAEMGQRYASDVVKGFAEGGNAGYFLAIRTDPQASPCGFLAIPYETARAWGKLLLGESPEPPNEGQKVVLSELEESLLYGTAKGLVDKVGLMDPSLGVFAGERFTVDQLPAKWPGTDTLLTVTMAMRPGETEIAQQVTLVLPCRLFHPLVGWKPEEEAMPGSKRVDCSAAIMAFVEGMKVPLAALLGRASLKLADLMGLRVDDVLVLDRSVHEMIDIQFAGRIAFRGIPGRRQRQQAVLIADGCHRKQ